MPEIMANMHLDCQQPSNNLNSQIKQPETSWHQYEMEKLF